LGYDDGYIAKYDNNGNFIYANTIGLNNTWQYANSLALDSFGNAFVSGLNDGPPNGSVVHFSKYDINGSLLWKRFVGFSGNNERENQSIGLDPAGNIYLACNFNSNLGDFDPGPAVVTLNPIGWTNIFFAKYNSFAISIDELTEQNNLSIFPNPLSSTLTIDSELYIKRINILDITGKTIKAIQEGVNTINVTEIPSGVYFIQLITDEGIITEKIVKQ